MVARPGVDILLVDDHSDEPLIDLIQAEFSRKMDRITVLRPDAKLYSGGCKNIGLRRALDEGYRIAVLMDSDIIIPPSFFSPIARYFRDNPRDVVVAPAISPAGRGWQYADTLINFSCYFPQSTREVSWKACLAGYAFALHIPVFRHRPCFLPVRTAGDDVLFFRELKGNFGIEHFPLLNQVVVSHRPPRSTLKNALSAQRRYARAFFSHSDQRRAYLFNMLPLLHLLTPRFFLMLLRLTGRRRFRDFGYSPLCWYLDFRRAVQIVRLSLAGYQDPANTFPRG
jgi:glycosyltransferase involved in cell wall biosynthesis